jgi:hypothetical protein
LNADWYGSRSWARTAGFQAREGRLGHISAGSKPADLSDQPAAS